MISFIKYCFCSFSYAFAAIIEFSTTFWTLEENQPSKPKLIEIVAKIATIIVGNNAINVNTFVSLVWSLKPEVRDLLDKIKRVIRIATNPAIIKTVLLKIIQAIIRH